jgi:hypothetical protein
VSTAIDDNTYQPPHDVIPTTTVAFAYAYASTCSLHAHARPAHSNYAISMPLRESSAATSREVRALKSGLKDDDAVMGSRLYRDLDRRVQVAASLLLLLCCYLGRLSSIGLAVYC